MDLIKIGKYIAFKRKEQGLTQKQLAEKLNMSDKSVSKWERGICLPDVSIYLELCKILDISINEFLAGEDIPKETIEQKAEENIIQITKDNKNKQKYLKKIIRLLIVMLVVFIFITDITKMLRLGLYYKEKKLSTFFFLIFCCIFFCRKKTVLSASFQNKDTDKTFIYLIIYAKTLRSAYTKEM